MLQRLTDVDDAIDCNANIADEIFRCGLKAFGISESEVASAAPRTDSARELDQSKAHSTIRQLYRDWSAEGSQERKCYNYVMEHLWLFSEYRPVEVRQNIRVLVPGAGLGRLVYDIYREGFSVEGNEVSYHQLLASNWVLNHSGTVQRPLYPLYPFATQFSNNKSRAQQLRKVMVPDIIPTTESSLVGHFGEMSMSAGDFLLVYGSEDAKDCFDAVVTVFFIDTAPNLVRYIETVLNCLRPGGVWINTGPLLWHHAGGKGPAEDQDAEGQDTESPRTSSADTDRDHGIGEPGSVELTEEEVIWLLEKQGFDIVEQTLSDDLVGYIQDPASLFQNKYQMSSWVVRRK